MQISLPDKAQCLFEQRRYTVLHGGRGSAKSHSVARALLLMASQAPLRVLCCREIQRSIRDSVHRLLSDCIESMGLSSFFDVLDTEIRAINGALFIFSGLSTQTVESIKSLEGVDLVWVEEAQSISDKSWSMLIPTIRKPGSRFILTMNPQLESDPTSQRFLVNPPPDCLAVAMNWQDNPWFPAELDAERRYHETHYPDTYDHVWGGSYLPAVEGAIYFKEVQAAQESGRIGRVPYDRKLPVHTGWDLGVRDSTSIVMWQQSGREVWIIDYYEATGEGIAHYAQVLQERGYVWGTHWAPHDIQVRELGTGKSRLEVAASLGIKYKIVPQIGLKDGVDAVRDVFSRLWIDEGKCKRLIDCLKNYRWAMNLQLNEPKPAPVHDWASHGADALRYMAVAINDKPKREKQQNEFSPIGGGWMG